MIKKKLAVKAHIYTLEEEGYILENLPIGKRFGRFGLQRFLKEFNKKFNASVTYNSLRGKASSLRRKNRAKLQSVTPWKNPKKTLAFKLFAKGEEKEIWAGDHKPRVKDICVFSGRCGVTIAVEGHVLDRIFKHEPELSIASMRKLSLK